MIYIVTCDKSSWILKATMPLLEKYWTGKKEITILGYSKPELVYRFISMKDKQVNIDHWAGNIYYTLRNEPGEFVIFMLDDYLPIDYVNLKILNYYLDAMKGDQDIVRCGLGSDMSFWPHKVIDDFEDYQIIEKTGGSYYITCQPSIWRKDYLLSILARSTNPWQFEVGNGNDGKRMLSSKGKYAFRYIAESALSSRHPGKVNILGLKLKDVKWLIDKGVFNPDDLQFGQYKGVVAQYKDHGHYFRLSMLRKYIDSLAYQKYRIKYSQNYD